VANDTNIQNPFSLIPEEEKEDLVQDILNIDKTTGLPEEEDDSFVDTLLDTPGIGFGPLSIKQTYKPALSLLKAGSASVQKAVPMFRQNMLDMQYLSEEEDIRQEMGKKKPVPTFGIGFGEGAASRLLLGKEQNLLESARAEQEEKFNNLPIEEKKQIVNKYIGFIEENTDAWNELQNQIDSIEKASKLSKTEKALSAGMDSLILMTPAIVATMATKNPAFATPMLPFFGYLEMGSSYRQARMSGLDHDKAVKVSTINALSEIGTEAFPLPFVSKTLNKYWKANGANVNTFIRDGFGTTIRELGAENVNTIIQETNNAMNGVNTELKFAWLNKDNPNYKGPSWIDVMLDNAAMTSIATVVGAGGMIGMQGTAAFAPDIKMTLNDLDPNLARRLGRELEISAKQVNSTYKSVDETYSFLHASKQFDPGARSILQMQEEESGTPFVPNRQYYNFVMPEILPDEYMAQRIIQNDPMTEGLSEEEIELANQLQEEIAELDGNELKEALIEGKKVLNIMGADQIIDPQTFNDEVSQRVIEINGQINAADNQSTIQNLEEDKKILQSYLSRFQPTEELNAVAKKDYDNIYPQNDQEIVEDDVDRALDIGRDIELISQPVIDSVVVDNPDLNAEIDNIKQKFIAPLAWNPNNLNLITIKQQGKTDQDGAPQEQNYNTYDLGDFGFDSIVRSALNPENNTFNYSYQNFSNNTNYKNTRDLNDSESDIVARALYGAFNNGLPETVLKGINFIGVHSSIQSNTKEQTSLGLYTPESATITLSQKVLLDENKISENLKTKFELDNFDLQSFTYGAQARLQQTLVHEIAHHIDYNFTQSDNPNTNRKPFSADSPLFNFINFDVETKKMQKQFGVNSITEIPIESLQNYKFETGGPVMREMFSMYFKSQTDKYSSNFSGNELGYPFNRILIDLVKWSETGGLPTSEQGYLDSNNNIQFMNDGLNDFVKSELFAQAFSLYYNNPKFFEQNAPETTTLIKGIENAVSNNRFSQVGFGIRDSFQSPRSDADSQVYSRRIPERYAQTGSEQGTTYRGVERDGVGKDRDDVRSTEQVNYISIGELSPKSDGTYDGAPRLAPGVFKNTQKDFNKLANDLVKLAEQKDLSLVDESRNWYKNVNDEVDILVQGNPKLKEDVMRLLTIYSSQTPVETNLAYTLRSLVAMAKGADPLPGFQPEAGQYAKAALAAPDFGQKLEGVGWKLQSFYENLTGKNPNAVTMDTWMFNLLGFQKGQGALANHRYGTSVIQKATDIYNKKNNDNLTPMEMQAVLWTYARNKQLQEKGKPAEYVGYETFLEKASSIVTAEVIPTESLQQFAFAEKLSDKKKAEMTKELLDVITTSEGRNDILNLFPGTGLYKFSHSFGAYDGKINPNIIANLILEKVQGEQQFSERDLEFADDFLRAWGYVFRQEAVPYFSSNESIKDEDIADLNNESVNSGSVIKFVDTASGAVIEISSLMRKQLKAALEKEGIDGFTQIDAGGISIINFKFDGNIIEDFDNKIDRAMSSVEIEGVGFASEHGIKYNTQYLKNNWRDNPNGEGYLQGQLTKRSIQQGLDRIRAKVDAIYDKYRNQEPERGPDGSFPTTGSESSAISLEPVSKAPDIPQEQSDAIDNALDGIDPPAPPAPPAPPKGPDPDGDFSLPEMRAWADTMEAFNIKVANKFGRLWTIEENIIEQFGNNAITQRLIDAGIDPNSKDWRVSTQTDIFPGRVKDLLRDIRENYYEPLLEFLTAKGISEQEYNHFIYNLHAPERNAYLPTLFQDQVTEAEQNLEAVQNNVDSSPQDIINAKSKLTSLQNKLKKAESGSGITTEQALATLKKYGVIYDLNDQKARGSLTKGKNLLKAFEDFHKPLLENTRKTLSDSGLIAEELIQDWSSRYKYYVPLVGFAEDTLIDPETGRELQRPQSKNNLINSQMTVSGQLIKKAKGRESLADSPLQQSIIQATGAAINSEKNRVTKSLADLARSFPSDLWSVSEDVGQIKSVDAKWDPVKGRSRVGFKEDGVQKYVEIYDKRLALGFDNFDSQVTNPFMKGARAVTRYLSMVNTSLDPSFMINNFLRDVQTGYFNLMAEEELPNGRAQALEISKKYYTSKNILSNAVNLVRFEKSRSLNAEAIKNELDSIATQGIDITPEILKQVEKKYQLSDDMARKQVLLRKFKEYGGETGYIEQKTIDQLTKEFEDLRDMYSGTFKGNAKSAYKTIFSVIERMNMGIENAARFTAFEGYVESMGGLQNATPVTYERAASLAKNLTINFNRMGTMGPTVNALYMFFNASVQGSVNVFRGLTPGNVSSRKSKALIGLYGTGLSSTLYNILASGEDEDGRLYYEKISEWEKQTKFIFMFPDVEFIDGDLKIEKWGSGSKYHIMTKDGRKYPIGLGIPMPYGYAIFANTGRVTAELAMGNVLDNYDKSLAKAGLDLGESFLHNYAPISISINEGSVLRDLGISATPTFAKPLVELMANRDHFGTPIYFEPKFGQLTPRSYNENKRVLGFIKNMTRSVNNISGGNEYYSGDQDWDPAIIQYVLDYATGGLGRTAKRSYQLAFSPDRPRIDQIPFLRRITVSPKDSEDMQLFYENVEKVKEIEFAYRQLNEAMDPGEDAEDFLDRVGGDTGIASLGNLLNAYSTRKYGNNSIIAGVTKEILTNKKAMESARSEYYESNPLKYYQIYDELDLERLLIMKEFNKAYFEALEEQENN